jgi:hypothetical protein
LQQANCSLAVLVLVKQLELQKALVLASQLALQKALELVK